MPSSELHSPGHFGVSLGTEHLDVATSLNNLAVLYRKQGNYSAAEPFFQRSLAILEKSLGAEHPHVATSLNNLAALYYRTHLRSF